MSLPALFVFRHACGNHKLVRWRFVIHWGVDEDSRAAVFLKFASNNQSETVLENLIEACEGFRVPTRIRTNHVIENEQKQEQCWKLQDVKPIQFRQDDWYTKKWLKGSGWTLVIIYIITSETYFTTYEDAVILMLSMTFPCLFFILFSCQVECFQNLLQLRTTT